MKIRIFSTGGTFDKHYDEISGKLVFSESIIPTLIQRARIENTVMFEPLFSLDSLDMQDEHRQQISSACTKTNEEKIVIIHGTDTMRETAAVIALAHLNKTIVLTGAMVPYEMLHSDALFNFGFACAAVQTLKPGIYITMNGQIFNWDNVYKNRQIGIFQTEKIS